VGPLYAKPFAPNLRRVSPKTKHPPSQHFKSSSSHSIHNTGKMPRKQDIELEDEEPPTIEPYKILGIEKSATADEVKAAYRKAALKHHPGMRFTFILPHNKRPRTFQKRHIPLLFGNFLTNHQTKQPRKPKTKPPSSSKKSPSPTPFSPTPSGASDMIRLAQLPNQSILRTSVGASSTLSNSGTSSPLNLSRTFLGNTRTRTRRKMIFLMRMRSSRVTGERSMLRLC
jgi:hypothetical protein